MPRTDDVLLDVDGIVAERILRLAARGVERGLELRALANDAHSLPASARRGLEQHRDSRTRCAIALGVGGVLNGLVVPGTTGTPAAMASCRAAVLLPIAAIASAGGPIEHEPLVANESREPLALRQKPISGMDRLGADCASAASMMRSPRR